MRQECRYRTCKRDYYMRKNILRSILAIICIAVILYFITPSSTISQYLIKAERSLAHLEVERIKVGELEIEYLRGGSGKPLVLLHGFGADKDNWNRIARYLIDDFDVIAIDLPGFGNSTKDIELNYDVQSQIDRLKLVTEALGLKKFHLAGNSMGGYIAGNFAVQYPESVESLWLISPFGVERAQVSEMFLATKQGQNPVVLARTENEFSALFSFLFVEPPFVPSPIISHLANKAKEHADINTKIFEQIHRMKGGEPHPDLPLDSTLENYTGRVLISWGDKDRVLHASGAMVLKSVAPHAKSVVMPNVGHLPMVEAPSKTADSFLLFAK